MQARHGSRLAVGVLFVWAATLPVLGAQTGGPGRAHVPGSLGIPQPEPRITLTLERVTLHQALREIFSRARYDYRLLARAGAHLYDLSVEDVPLTRALAELLAQDPSTDPLVFTYETGPTGRGVFTLLREVVTLDATPGALELSAVSARLPTLLQRVFTAMRVPHELAPEVPPVLVTLRLRPRTWDDLLRAVLVEAAGKEPALAYSRQGATHHVHLHRSRWGVSQGTGTPLLDLPSTPTPLRLLLFETLGKHAFAYRVADEIPDVELELDLRRKALWEGLEEVLQQASMRGLPVTYREAEGVVWIEPGYIPRHPREEPSARGGTTEGLRFERRPLPEIVRALEAATGHRIHLQPDVPPVRVSVDLSQAGVAEALTRLQQAVSEQLPGLEYQRDPGGAWQVGFHLSRG